MLNLIIGFLNDVIIVAGTAITTAMLATKVVEMPAAPVWLVALIMGLVQAARRLDSKIAPSPVKTDDPPEARTPAQLEAQIKVTEDTIATVVDRVTQAIAANPPTPVTPKRVEETPPPTAITPGSVL